MGAVCNRILIDQKHISRLLLPLWANVKYVSLRNVYFQSPFATPGFHNRQKRLQVCFIFSHQDNIVGIQQDVYYHFLYIPCKILNLQTDTNTWMLDFLSKIIDIYREKCRAKAIALLNTYWTIKIFSRVILQDNSGPEI